MNPTEDDNRFRFYGWLFTCAVFTIAIPFALQAIHVHTGIGFVFIVYLLGNLLFSWMFGLLTSFEMMLKIFGLSVAIPVLSGFLMLMGTCVVTGHCI